LADDHDEATAIGYLSKLKDLEILSHFALLNDLLQPLYKIDKQLQEAALPLAQALEKIKFEKLKLSLIFQEENNFGFSLAQLKEEFEKSMSFGEVPIGNKDKLSFTDIKEKGKKYGAYILEQLNDK